METTLKPLDDKWNEDTLRAWATSWGIVGCVQARQVLLLLNDIALLRVRVKELEIHNNEQH